MVLRYFIICFLSFLLLTVTYGCAKRYALNDGSKITKRKILAEVQSFIEAKETSNYYRSKKLRIRDRSIEQKEYNKDQYSRYDTKKVGKLYDSGRTNQKKTFIIKTGNDVRKYHKTEQINIFQPPTINDELFENEINRVVELLENGDIQMVEIKDKLNQDLGISVQYFKNSIFIAEEKFKPEVKRLLNHERILSVYKSEKTKMGDVTYLSLIQNTGISKVNPVCHYLSIVLK